ncbi:PREDICTED: protein FAR1-RELATED SEQUENCE 5-like [Ipomoea nil]|uniref:protein FAR1-RELATED SEQUENCE 5-like n=1 Tax=Ipomoea nil TaxID=35883 RepID=UPI0009014E82|nr:PREDICTED: protein FAR1-RELATED SEQUENCE 5-like [Ipomoea nil]
MKEAMPQVFPETRHQFCMWHIMTKVGEKVGGKLAKDEKFRKELNVIVWDKTLGREEYEIQWNTLMTEYSLEEHKWFKQMYEIRSSWIEAYYNDVFMGGLMRTTSRSESENGLFGGCINTHGTLLEFFTQFESAIDMQWHNQARLVAECETSYPPMKTPLQIEKHASSLYTNTISYDIQTEILEGSFSCKISRKEQATDHVLYTIQEGKKKSFTVQYYKENETVRCSCGKFTRVGILCRHAFAVLKDDDAEEMLDWILEHKNKLLKTKEKRHDTNNKNELLETFYGTQATTAVQVKPPQVSKNKGSGKRLKSTWEKAQAKKRKDGRTCHYCDEEACHDSRNCPLKPPTGKKTKTKKNGDPKN